MLWLVEPRGVALKYDQFSFHLTSVRFIFVLVSCPPHSMFNCNAYRDGLNGLTENKLTVGELHDCCLLYL